MAVELAIRSCSVEECSAPVKSRGMCRRHYSRLYRSGAVPRRSAARACSVDGCVRPVKARGWCGTHYQRFLKTGDPIRTKIDLICSIDGCDKPICSSGYCSAHYTRLKRHGDPLAPLQRMKQSGICTVGDCNQPAKSRGWCAGHAAQADKTGRPPEPFKYKWAERGPCIVCGEPCDERGRRQFCSGRCQMLVCRSRKRGQPEVPKVAACALCGDVIDLFVMGRGGRKRRADTRLCTSCRKANGHRHKYPAKLLRNRDGANCALCGEPVDFDRAHPDPLSPSVDHVIPRARGGSDDPSNLQLAHLGCNQKKHARMPDEMVA